MRNVAIVTGAERGIGAAVARRLAAAGFTLVVAGIDDETAAAVATGLPNSGHVAHRVDVSDEVSVQALFETAESRLGPVMVLVCNAGVLILQDDGERPDIAETSLEDWEQTHAVNTRGTFLCCREMLRRRRRRPVVNGRIVTFSSVAAQLGGYRSSAAYISSKSAVLGFTKAMAREAAADGITVNAVAPGVIDAPMLRQSLNPGDEESAAAAIPLGRLGTPEDVAEAVAYLVSPEAGYLTGVTIDVNGGYRMQ